MKPNLSINPRTVLFGIQLVLAYEWLTAGYKKVSQGQFAGAMDKTLAAFGEGNPNRWYVDSVLAFAKEHATLFGQLVQWSEVAIGLSLIITILITLYYRGAHTIAARLIAASALLGGALMNANFYVASGWSSPSSAGLNLLMFWVQLFLAIYWMLPSKPLGKTKK